MLTSKDVCLVKTGKLCGGCLQCCVSHGSETWPVKKENEIALQRAEMRMIRWMCSDKVTDRFTCNELRETGNR